MYSIIDMSSLWSMAWQVSFSYLCNISRNILVTEPPHLFALARRNGLSCEAEEDGAPLADRADIKSERIGIAEVLQ